MLIKSVQNNKFDRLVDRLTKDYGPDHPVINYMASVSPVSEAIIRRHTIKDLYEAEIQATVTGATTFYLPPKELLPITSDGEKLMIGDNNKSIKIVGDVPIFPPFPFNHSLTPVSPPYGPDEMKAVATLKDHTKPIEYKPYSASLAMQRAVESLSLSLHATNE